MHLLLVLFYLSCVALAHRAPVYKVRRVWADTSEASEWQWKFRTRRKRKENELHINECNEIATVSRHQWDHSFIYSFIHSLFSLFLLHLLLLRLLLLLLNCCRRSCPPHHHHHHHHQWGRGRGDYSCSPVVVASFILITCSHLLQPQRHYPVVHWCIYGQIIATTQWHTSHVHSEAAWNGNSGQQEKGDQITIAHSIVSHKITWYSGFMTVG